MCNRGAPAALVGCSVEVEGCFAASTAGAVAYVRSAGDEKMAVLLAKVRANEQLGQAIVICVLGIWIWAYRTAAVVGECNEVGFGARFGSEPQIPLDVHQSIPINILID